MDNKILSDEEIFYIPVTSKDDKPSHLNEIARIIRLIQEDTATAQAALTASQKDAEIAQKQEDYDDVYKALQQRDNMLEKAEARIKELEAKLKEQWEWSQGALDWRESEIGKAKAEAIKDKILSLDIAKECYAYYYKILYDKYLQLLKCHQSEAAEIEKLKETCNHWQELYYDILKDLKAKLQKGKLEE